MNCTKKSILRLAVVILVFSLSVAGNALPPLRAVLIVGPQEDGTEDAAASMDQIAQLLSQKGIQVQRFYDHQANWESIVTAARDANFLVYSGHGSTMGEEDGHVGGLCLTSMVSSNEMIRRLQLHPNAMVLFQSVCGGAGSSASDDGDIGIEEAVQRVSDYSHPFFQIGATAYYANNYVNGCLRFLEDFFSGKTLSEAFELSAKQWNDIEYDEVYDRDRSKRIAVTSNQPGGMMTRITYHNGVKSVETIPASKDYSVAYAGKPDLTFSDLLRR